MARPPYIHRGFIGQRRAWEFLIRQLEGAQALGERAPHLLLQAPSGHGKTQMARTIAVDFGTACHEFFAGPDTRPLQLCQELSKLRFGDFLFIDEAHALRSDAQEILYVALDQEKVPAIVEGRLRRGELKSIASFSLILATNEPGALKEALCKRLQVLAFDPYAARELKYIAEDVATKSTIHLTPHAARRLAETSQGVPRLIRHCIDALKRHWPGLREFTQVEVDDLLSAIGIDQRGLIPQQRQLLSLLAESSGGSMSVELLATRMCCDAAYVRRDLEPYLLAQGYMTYRSGLGRVLTPSGRALVAEWGTMCEPEDVEEDMA